MRHKTGRWAQRADNFARALAQLREAVALANTRELSQLEAQGLIQGFEYTHELAWHTLRDFLVERGHVELYGPKDTTREAFKAGLIEQGENWMAMIRSRNLTSHTYNEDTAKQIVTAIISTYFAELQALQAKLEQLRREKPA